MLQRLHTDVQYSTGYRSEECSLKLWTRSRVAVGNREVRESECLSLSPVALRRHINWTWME